MADIIVLGLDPGSNCTGVGLVAEGSGVCRLVHAGTIRTPKSSDPGEKLGVIYERLSALIAEHSPGEAAIEDVFVSANSRSALKLGQARGAALAACGSRGVPVAEYPPTVVKKSLVGTGRAEKSQVAFMAAQILGIKSPSWAKDASDALAVALCHLNQRRFNKLTGLA